MPFYDYVCEKCGHEMEVMHSVHGNGPAACPDCGGPMKKAITAAAVHYKGSGWARKERTGKTARPAEDLKSKSSGGESSESSSTPASRGDSSESTSTPASRGDSSESTSTPASRGDSSESSSTPASGGDPAAKTSD